MDITAMFSYTNTLANSNIEQNKSPYNENEKHHISFSLLMVISG